MFILFQPLLHAEWEEAHYVGRNIFINNCAVCHGEDGQGGGPMTEQLTKPASNLTVLSKNNGGSFPETVIYQLIDGRRVVLTDEGRALEPFHGPRDMPIWGDTFRTIERDEGAVDELISNLLVFLKNIQIK
ncbi:MAG: cytochrome c [Gammaproteobacteria bacterium]